MGKPATCCCAMLGWAGTASHAVRAPTLLHAVARCPQEAKRGYSSAAVFIARNRFAALDKAANQIIIKDLSNEVGRGGVPFFGGTIISLW